MTGPTGRRRPGVAAERGSATVELVVLSPVVVLIAVVIAALGRVETVRAQVAGAARAAAAAAAEASDPLAAVTAARDMAPVAVAGDGVSCRPLSVQVDTSNFTAGGAVAVTVRCHVSMAGLLVPGFPGRLTVSSRVVASVDPYRSVG